MKPANPAVSAALDHLERELTAQLETPPAPTDKAIDPVSAPAAPAAPGQAPGLPPARRPRRPGRRAQQLSWLSAAILVALAASQILWPGTGNAGQTGADARPASQARSPRQATPPQDPASPRTSPSRPPQPSLARSGAPSAPGASGGRPTVSAPSSPSTVVGAGRSAPAVDKGAPTRVSQEGARGMGEEETTAPTIRVVRQRPPAISPLRQAAQRALEEGDWALARQHFQSLLHGEPHHIEALLALAKLAEHEGQPRQAENYRERAWQADPSDPMVLAAWLNRPAAQADPVASESQLRGLLRRHPEVGALHFALGNLLAHQGRWPEARQAYADAASSDGDNADYQFNLAVSLEQLRQPQEAARHYRLALAAAHQRAGAFAGTLVEARLQQLAAARQP